MARTPKVALCGPSRSGKDVAALWLATHTGLRFARTTSEAIAPYVARRLGLTPEEAFARRHRDRRLWFEVGNEMRAGDPTFLVRETLREGDICVGLRQADEVAAARAEELIDLFVWIDRDVPVDPTMGFGPELCDVIVPNHGSLGITTRGFLRWPRSRVWYRGGVPSTRRTPLSSCTPDWRRACETWNRMSEADQIVSIK